MTAEKRARKFVRAWRRDKDENLTHFRNLDRLTGVKIAAMGLSPEQDQQLTELLDVVLTDIYYGLLLGLDGEASIGGDQQQYEIRDENGKRVGKPGEIEVAAYDLFTDQAEKDRVQAWHRQQLDKADSAEDALAQLEREIQEEIEQDNRQE